MFKSGKEPWDAKCVICDQIISIANKGKADLEKHLNTEKHKMKIRSTASTSRIDIFMESNANLNLQRSVRATEATLVYHTVKHHESFNSLDCTAPLCKSIYPDSKIAKDVTCSRSKAEAILKNVLGPFAQENMLKEVSKIRYLSVSTDSSNHGAIKLFPVLIQYFNPEKGGIQVKLLELQALPNETAETISTYIHTILTDKNLLDKLIAFSADNTNTNFGGRERSGTNSVYSRLKSATQNDDMVGVGCIAHIFSNSVHHAIESLPICVDSIVMQMHNHFASFTVRTEALKKVCSELEIDFKRMLSHSKTRWLSLYPAIERILQMYEPLKSYFLSLSYPARTLQMFFENDFSECYLWLLHSFMSIYQSRIKHTETADISVNEVIDQCSQVVENINERLEQNFCPMKVTEILRRLSEARRDEVEDFKQNMRRMYNIAKDYLNSWTSEFCTDLKHFQWMTLANIPSWEQGAKTIDTLSRKNVQLNDNKFFDQWQNFIKFLKQHEDDSDFKKLLAHQKWTSYFKSFNNEEFYSELLKLAEYYFAIPGHNANVERVFSLINAQWTKERSRLQTDTIAKMMFLLCNLKLTCKEFYDMISKENEILDKVGASAKYN